MPVGLQAAPRVHKNHSHPWITILKEILKWDMKIIPLLLLETVITTLHRLFALIALREDKSALGKSYY